MVIGCYKNFNCSPQVSGYPRNTVPSLIFLLSRTKSPKIVGPYVSTTQCLPCLPKVGRGRGSLSTMPTKSCGNLCSKMTPLTKWELRSCLAPLLRFSTVNHSNVRKIISKRTPTSCLRLGHKMHLSYDEGNIRY